MQGNEKDTVEATFSELSKVDDLFSLAAHCLSNDFEESGDVEDAPALSEVMGVVGAGQYKLDKRQDKM